MTTITPEMWDKINIEDSHWFNRGYYQDNPLTGGLYFAYGANLDKLAMSRRCPRAIPISRAWLPDWSLEFKGVCDIEHVPGATVHGGLWSISMKCEAALDSFEGAPDFYRKERHTVMTPTGPYEAMVYIMNDQPWMDYYSMPSSGYFDTVMDGYKDFDLPEPALWAAIDRVVDFTQTLEPAHTGTEFDSILNEDWEEVEGVYVDDLWDDGDAYEAGLLDTGKSPATIAMDQAELDEKIKNALDRSDGKDKLTRLKRRLARRKAYRSSLGEPVMEGMAKALSEGAQ